MVQGKGRAMVWHGGCREKTVPGVAGGPKGGSRAAEASLLIPHTHTLTGSRATGASLRITHNPTIAPALMVHTEAHNGGANVIDY